MNAIETIKPELLTLSAEQFSALTPFFSVLGGTCIAVLFCGIFKGEIAKWLAVGATLLTCVVGSLTSMRIFGNYPIELFNQMMVVDSFSSFFNIIFLLSAAFTILISIKYLDRERIQYPEYYVLILFSVIGMMAMVSSLDLIVIFIALELMSLTVYTLVGFRRADRKSNEASLKYFVMGGVASAIMLYGVAMVYGASGSTNLTRVLEALYNGTQAGPIFSIGAWMVVIGFLFKVASVPFHMWMPDVYEGAPSPITGFMTTGLKAASFATFIRVFVSFGFGQEISESVSAYLHDLIWWSAVLTMIVGNFIALTQTNLKRMLAYSSIAHTGYLLVGLISGAGSELSYSSMITYLVVYSVMNLGAFTLLTVMSTARDGNLNLHDLSGVCRRHPWLSFCMAVFLLSMAGIPPTAGFVAKYFLFYSAVQAGEVSIVVIAVLCSAVSVYYYLRVLVYMYMRESSAAQTRFISVPVWSAVTLAVMVVLTLQVGLMPAGLVEFAKMAVVGL